VHHLKSSAFSTFFLKAVGHFRCLLISHLILAEELPTLEI
jgi:hypothetical protein